MLHIVAKLNTLESCLRVVNSNDVILLIEDAVSAVDSNKLENYLVYALKADVEARGLLNKVTAKIQLIDYADFVELTIQHYPIQTWS